MHKAVRSKALIMERVAEIDGICNNNWDSIIPDDLSSDFYASFPSQLNYLKSLHVLKICDLCYILRISTKTYYKILPIIEKGGEDIESPMGRPPIVSEIEENALLKQLELQQLQGDCLSPRQAREWLENYIKEKGRSIILDRNWWFRFKTKNIEHFSVMKIHSLEFKRADVSRNDINNHFDKLGEAFKTLRAPSLTINMDESGFIKRPNKNSTKNCICMKKCCVPPTFRDEVDGNHVSIVASVTLSGKSLQPLLLSTTEKPPKEVTESVLHNDFLWMKTKKGYLNEEAMIFWVNKVLLPYINHTQQYFTGQEIRPLLIFDGLKAHLTDQVKSIFEQNNIDILTLPPHSSHLLQCLDLCFFGVMKRSFRLSRSYLFTKDQKRAQKIERVMKAFHAASFPPIIIAGWKASGIDMTFKDGNIISIALNRSRVLSKILNE